MFCDLNAFDARGVACVMLRMIDGIGGLGIRALAFSVCMSDGPFASATNVTWKNAHYLSPTFRKIETKLSATQRPTARNALAYINSQAAIRSRVSSWVTGDGP